MPGAGPDSRALSLGCLARLRLVELPTERAQRTRHRHRLASGQGKLVVCAEVSAGRVRSICRAGQPKKARFGSISAKSRPLFSSSSSPERLPQPYVRLLSARFGHLWPCYAAIGVKGEGGQRIWRLNGHIWPYFGLIWAWWPDLRADRILLSVDKPNGHTNQPAHQAALGHRESRWYVR